MKFLLLMLTLSFSHPATATVCDNLGATGLDDAVVTKFRDSFLTALKEGSAKKVAAMVRYPIAVKVAGAKKAKTFANAQQLESSFDKVFPKATIEKLLSAPATDTVCRDQGVGLASGTVWIHAPNMDKLNDIKILSINP